jgi:two-component system, OmpR family, phosphate regulon sensor histidine kinase PhoR
MSSKRKSKKKVPFRLAFRLALYSGLSIILILAPAVYFLFSLSLPESLLISISTGLIVLTVVYFFTWQFLYKRLETIHTISKNITRKKFDEYEDIQIHNKDELDHVITQSIRASKTVERELQRLNKIENYRKEFIGDISHELKTPIFAIQGFVETLLNGALEDEEVNRVFLKKVMRNVNRLTYLTKDLMEISRLETGELKSNFQNLYLSNLVLDVVEGLQYKARNENVDIFVEKIDSDLQIKADRNQIKQVLVNLIENSVKYNKPGGHVRIGVKPFPRNQNKIILFVEDTGIGMEQSDLERVTERFFRVDKSRSREKGGTGLGLSIVKHIIEAHGEQLFIESAPEKGSTFSFTLSRPNHVSD